MGSVISSTTLRVFEFLNDVHIGIGSGVLGVFIFVYKGINWEIFRTLCIGGLTTTSLMYAFSSAETIKASSEKVVFVTGCDSGLGFSLAQHVYKLGFTVVAGCLNIKSDGAKELQKTCVKIVLIEIDLTKNDSIQNAVHSLVNYLDDNEPSEFWALLNNAGVMVFGEFEWLTEHLILEQLTVNIFGTMKLTKALLPLMRKYKARIITVTSHCANATLPGLAVYGSTKAALSAWSDGLRIELSKFGIPVIKFIPGSFVQQSNIMAKQNENVYEMQSALSHEQMQFYGDYFKRYNKYLSALSGERKPTKIDDNGLYEVFEKTLMEKYPSAVYVHETWRYKIFHTLFKITPTPIRDMLVVKFISMPKWENDNQIGNISGVIA